MAIIFDGEFGEFPEELFRTAFGVAESIQLQNASSGKGGVDVPPALMRGSHLTIRIRILEAKLHISQEEDGRKGLSSEDDFVVGYLSIQPKIDGGSRITIEQLTVPKATKRLVSEDNSGRTFVKELPSPNESAACIEIVSAEGFDRAAWFENFTYLFLLQADGTRRADAWLREIGHPNDFIEKVRFENGHLELLDGYTLSRYLADREKSVARQRTRMKERGEEASTLFVGRCKDAQRLVESVEALVTKHLPPRVGGVEPPLHSGSVELFYSGIPKQYEIRATMRGAGEWALGHIEISPASDTEYDFELLRYGNDAPEWFGHDYQAACEFFDALAEKLRHDYPESRRDQKRGLDETSANADANEPLMPPVQPTASRLEVGFGAMPTIRLRQSLSDVVTSVHRSLERGLTFLGEKYGLAIWSVGNCNINAFEPVKGVMEVKLNNFRLTVPDDDACEAWNHLATFWVEVGWITKPEMCYASEYEDEWTKALRSFNADPGEYDREWKARRQAELAPLANIIDVSKQVESSWREHRGEMEKRLKSNRELQRARESAASKTATEAAKEYWALLKRAQPPVSGAAHHQQQSAQADVMIVTATPSESKAVFDVFRQASGQDPKPTLVSDRIYQDLGVINSLRVFMVQSEIGSGGRGGSLLTVQKGIAALLPSAVIMVGIAFGVNETKQHIGDILVSQQMMPYDLQRVSTEDGEFKIIPRGDRPHASPRLINYFHSADLYWDQAKVKVWFGLILSGDRLMDNIDYRSQLHVLEPEALGGEMEGAGLYVACEEVKVDWILVRAICDWADGHKETDEEQQQQLAAHNAAGFVLYMRQHATLRA